MKVVLLFVCLTRSSGAGIHWQQQAIPPSVDSSASSTSDDGMPVLTAVQEAGASYSYLSYSDERGGIDDEPDMAFAEGDEGSYSSYLAGETICIDVLTTQCANVQCLDSTCNQTACVACIRQQKALLPACGEDARDFALHFCGLPVEVVRDPRKVYLTKCSANGVLRCPVPRERLPECACNVNPSASVS